MPIHEVEPRFIFGPFRLGSRLGRKLSEKDQGVTVGRKSEDDPFIGWVKVGVFANVIRDDAIVLTWWSEDDAFGYEQITEDEPIIGQAINKNPMLRGKLRYFP